MGAGAAATAEAEAEAEAECEAEAEEGSALALALALAEAEGAAADDGWSLALAGGIRAVAVMAASPLATGLSEAIPGQGPGLIFRSCLALPGLPALERSVLK